MWTQLQYRMLKKICPGEPSGMDGSAYAGKSKLRVLLGNRLIDQVAGKRVIDFGCADGHETMELARSGAAKVIGIDMREHMLERARQKAHDAGFDQVCEFVTSTQEKADFVVTVDAFEHFDDPMAILNIMYDLLVPGGSVLVSFGATWYHPLWGHLFSVFPWSHLIFSEKALLRWREDIRLDRPTKFSEIEGGLNQMTISRFEKIVSQSRFQLRDYELTPIRKLKRLHNRITREFTTSVIRCRLEKRAKA
jgi:SAM-dependent methyltransferase